MSALSMSRLERLHSAMAGHVERGGVPGIVALVDRRGETWAGAFGTLAAGGGASMRRDTLFRIASVTKPIIAAATMILVEECRLRLDDPVDPLLPELAERQVLRRIDGPLDETVPAKRAITVRDLLTFRLGFGSVMVPPRSTPIQVAISDLQIGGDVPPKIGTMPTPDEWMRRLGSLPLLHQPGEQWRYNCGADVLGVLIARASGQSLAAFLQERMFAPLGMKDTAFWVPPAAIDRLATCYAVDPSSGALVLFDPAVDGDWSRPPPFPSGAAGLVSTADDLLAFGRMLLGHGALGGARILSRPSVETMMTDQLTPAQKAASTFVPGFFDDLGWGFGGSVGTRRDGPARTVGRYGWDGGYGTSFYVDPQEQLIGVLLTQRGWTSPVAPPVCADFWSSAYQAIDD